MSRWAGRIITKNPVTPAGPAATGSAPGMWTIPEVAYWVKQGVWPDPANVPDPYWSYVSYLLGTTSTNAQTNNSFLDSSTNNLTVTRVGNATQGAVTPYGTLWSNYFDGNGDYLSVSAASALNQSGDFTVEAWVCLNASPSATTPIYAFEVTNFMKFAINTTRNLTVDQANVGVRVTGSTALSQGVWYHIAFVRSGTGTNNCKIYLNGVQEGQFTDTSTVTVSGTGRICSRPDATSGFLSCYLSNLRVTNTAVYTSAFTPPAAPLTAVSGTSLLTCQSNRFRDASSNAFAITVNGDTKVTPFSPFILAAPGYSGATYGGSLYLDAQGTTTTVPNVYAATSTGLDLQTTGTLEFWVYPTARATGASSPLNDASNMWAFYGTDLGSVTKYFGMGISSTGYLYISVDATSGAAGNTSTTFIPLNTWTHIAWVRSGGANKFYVNGADVTSTFSNPSVSGLWPTTATTNRAYIGVVPYLYSIYTYLYPFAGYISNFRVVKGTAVYTGAFTPPTTPLTAITNTSLLLNFTNAGIFDASMNNDMETTGNTQVSTGQAKFGTTSAYFNGSGVLSVPANPAFNFGTGDFTIECWVYPTSNPAIVYFVSQAASNDYAPVVFFFSSGRPGLAVSPSNGTWTINTYAASAVSTNTWSHVAAVRYGNKWSVYINGVETVLAASTAVTPYVSTDPLGIGGEATGAPNYPYYGYIDDLRITKGVARYTANFTPPTAALPVY